MVPPFPPAPTWVTFLICIKHILLLNIKDVEFNFRMGCILVLFQFLWIINVQFTNFWIFEFSKCCQICLFWSKITIIIIEISIKLYLHTKYRWNNPNSLRLGLKNQKNIFAISGNSKMHGTHKHSYTYKFSIFILNLYFFNAPDNVLHQNQ